MSKRQKNCISYYDGWLYLLHSILYFHILPSCRLLDKEFNPLNSIFNGSEEKEVENILEKK